MSAARPSPPSAVLWIARTLERAGFDTWTVGGSVRDVLLGHPAGDWDLTTRARPEEVRRLFKRTVPLGVEHGTVGVLAGDGTMFEVTTFRKDIETDGRHAVVAFADRVEDDLARRDFTVNAIAWHPLREELLDPHGGVADLEAGLLRTVGAPAERFAEDYLRVLRALRFAGRFGLRIDDATWSALCEVTPRLGRLSAERVRDELLKVLAADPVPSVSLGLYRSSGALGVVYPELAGLEAGSWSETLAVLDHLPPGRPLLRLAALLAPLDADQAAQLLIRIRLSNAQADETARWANAPELPAADAGDAAARRWLSRVGPQRLAPIARLALARARVRHDAPGAVVASWRALRRVRAARPPLTVKDLALDGRDLIRLGLKPGPGFRTILEGLLEWVLEDPRRNGPESLQDEVLRLHGGGGAGEGDV